jgi:glycosyltransferase involved in cell wall biosynthesis
VIPPGPKGQRDRCSEIWRCERVEPLQPSSSARVEQDRIALVKIAILTRSLVGGGTERQVAMLAGELAGRGHDCLVITFYSRAQDPRPAGVRIMDLRKRSRWDLVAPGLRLIRGLHGFHAEFLYAFLPVPNVVGVLIRWLFPQLNVIFGIRASDMQTVCYDGLSRLTYHAESFLARWAQGIIVNSAAGRVQAIHRGMPVKRIAIVRNGVDVDTFKPGDRANRRAWGWQYDAFLVGLVARWDPMKDHKTFVRALAHAKARVPKLAAVIVGGVPETARRELNALARGTNIHWVGWTNEIMTIYQSLDLCCLSSAWGEGSSNVLAEAMACSVPCVATDVGDNRLLIGKTGRIVSPNDPSALGTAIAELAALGPSKLAALGRAARAHIAEICSIDAMVSQTLNVFETTRAEATIAR